ncbi:MAG: hypothetical protein ACKO55_05980, partial [Bacteroidota bacterium]
MEIQLKIRFFISIFLLSFLLSLRSYSQKLTNITTESDGHRVIVKYDLENLPSNSYAKISLRFESSGDKYIWPSS